MIITEPRWKSYIVETTVPIFTPEQCQMIINSGRSEPRNTALVGNEQGSKGGRIDTETRTSHISWLPFSKTQEYIDLNWEMFNRVGYVETKLGKKIYKKNHLKLNPQQLFNYLIQSYETETNMQTISKLDKLLKNKKSKLILYVYDSFLFDFDKEDGKETLIKVKEIISNKYPIKLKIGENYNKLSAF